MRDSGKCSVAEAIMQSLKVEEAASVGVDFGVGILASREVPSEEEWGCCFVIVCRDVESRQYE